MDKVDESKIEEYIWYHDIKCNKSDKDFQLSLSDGRKINLKIGDIEKLQGLINKLERSL